ncbi:hypothetical protein LUZ61_012440 [Rhynchospora tenuis]|uniref:Peptidase A2 domain-containing protein n=1 Tax=Rhynchospora tenuis TaxID=198213 RepID=A0AAD6A358_9POAL|nr:hypothetical protein LUZ61_012440 [Rhynchospora tenuis]
MVTEGDTRSNGNRPRMTVGDYNVVAHLRKIPALLSVFDALMVSQELRESLIYALQNPASFQAYFAQEAREEVAQIEPEPHITFTDDDLMAGTADHNRPLYTTGIIYGKKINKILVDPGSSISIMPLKTLVQLSLSIRETKKDKIRIHGFNHQYQKALGSTVIDIDFGEIVTPVKFFIIEADTTYKALLGRPWLHENGLVPSTLHQCVKFTRDGKQCVIKGDDRPFEAHEAELDDAKYYQPRVEQGAALTKNASSSDAVREAVKRVILKAAIKSQTTQMLWGSDSEPESSEKAEDDVHSPARPCKDSGNEGEGQSSLAVEFMPMEHCKDLTPREREKISKLKTFTVPPKIEEVRFIKIGEVDLEDDQAPPEDCKRWLEESENETKMPPKLQRNTDARMKGLFHRTHCLEPISKRRIEMFQKFWDGDSNEVTKLNGKTSNTRGLGFDTQPGTSKPKTFKNTQVHTSRHISSTETWRRNGSRRQTSNEITMFDVLQRRFQEMVRSQQDVERSMGRLIAQNQDLCRQIAAKKQENQACREKIKELQRRVNKLRQEIARLHDIGERDKDRIIQVSQRNLSHQREIESLSRIAREAREALVSAENQAQLEDTQSHTCHRVTISDMLEDEDPEASNEKDGPDGNTSAQEAASIEASIEQNEAAYRQEIHELQDQISRYKAESRGDGYQKEKSHSYTKRREREELLDRNQGSHSGGPRYKETRNQGYTCHRVTITEVEEEEETLEAEPEASEGEQFILAVKNAPKELEEGGQNTIDELKSVNLGTEEDPRPTFISTSLNPDIERKLTELLKEYRDCFAWSYSEMPGLDPAIAVHKLKIDPEVKPVKQGPRRMRVELEKKVIAEVKKLINAGFIREEETPD